MDNQNSSIDSAAKVISRVKFNNKQIIDVFDLINDAIWNAGIGSNVLKPLFKEDRFRDFNGKTQTAKEYLQKLYSEGKLDGIDVNARGIVSCGTTYHKLSNEEMLDYGKKSIQKIMQTVNKTLASSADPLFSSLACDLKSNLDNAELIVVSTVGNDDEYGCEFFAKIHYI